MSYVSLNPEIGVLQKQLISASMGKSRACNWECYTWDQVSGTVIVIIIWSATIGLIAWLTSLKTSVIGITIIKTQTIVFQHVCLKSVLSEPINAFAGIPWKSKHQRHVNIVKKKNLVRLQMNIQFFQLYKQDYMSNLQVI